MSVILAGAAHADDLVCTLTDGTAVAFAIDRNQFVAPQDANDPPRRRVTSVTFGDATYSAEPFVIGSMRGFHADAPGGATVMFAVAADGAAKFTNTRSGASLTGRCRNQ